MTTPRPRFRLLIFVVAYNAERFITKVINRIPLALSDEYDTEILVIDDASKDQTFEIAATSPENHSPFKLTVLTNPVNQGYGGNQKLGYWYAIKNNFDFVALLHGDGQYAPELLPTLVKPLADRKADAVFGSRMIVPKDAISGGMPLYKFVGNRILSWAQNKLLKTSLSEFHSGYRVYSVDALKSIPFPLNAQGFHFDTEIIIQLLIAGKRIAELPIPTYYGDEICHVNGMRYAFDVMLQTLKARAQDFSIYYDRKYDCKQTASSNQHYLPKLDYRSPHHLALNAIETDSHVLDLGCAGGYMGEALKKTRNCTVTGVDLFPLKENVQLDQFIEHDLDQGPPDIDYSDYDYVLFLDVIEHLKSPEEFVSDLREKLHPRTKVIVSTANIAFFITRFSLLFGSFNYGKRGILDLTHTRLFTFKSIIDLFKQANYEVLEVTGTPIPFPLIFGQNGFSRFLVNINTLLLLIFRRFFSYQSFLIVQPNPTLDYLMAEAEQESKMRLESAVSVGMQSEIASSD